jgi:hypothetical protein
MPMATDPSTLETPSRVKKQQEEPNSTEARKGDADNRRFDLALSLPDFMHVEPVVDCRQPDAAEVPAPSLLAETPASAAVDCKQVRERDGQTDRWTGKQVK